MPVPRVAIVGRPNVGKSSLINMLAGRKVSIVDPTPGVTRDRVSALVELTGADGQRTRLVEFTDTGGYGVYTAEGRRFDEVGNDLGSLTDDVEFQIAEAVAGADMVLFCVDTQAGITAQDLEIARLLREQRLGQARRNATGVGGAPRLVPVRVVATKVDGPKWETHAVELAGLGFDEPLMCSAMNNYLRRALVETLFEIVPHVEDEAGEAQADLRIAIIGRRNTGKSTLVNTLAGAPRVIVSEIPGTTRDAVDVRFERDGRSILAIDTAGLRRKKSFQGAIEHYAFDRMKRAIDRCDVVLLMVDATEQASQVDEQLAWLAQRSYKPVILVLNKWDLAEGRKTPKGKRVGPEDFETYLRKEFKGLSFAPIAIMSAQTGLNVDETIDLAFDLQEQSRSRISTGELNRVLRGIIERQGPTSGSGVHTKVYYAAQIRCEPPTIVLIVNHPALFKPNYMRFLENRLREIVPFAEIPFRIVVRAKRRDEMHEPDAGREGGVSVGQAAAAAKLERRKGRGGVGVGAKSGLDADALMDGDDAGTMAGAGAGGVSATGGPDAGKGTGKRGSRVEPAKTEDGFVMEGLSQEELDEILSQEVTEADSYFEDAPEEGEERKPEKP